MALGFYAILRLAQGGHVAFADGFVALMVGQIAATGVGRASLFFTSLNKGRIAATKVSVLLFFPHTHFFFSSFFLSFFFPLTQYLERRSATDHSSKSSTPVSFTPIFIIFLILFFKFIFF